MWRWKKWDNKRDEKRNSVRKWCDQILLIITYNIYINRQVINIFVDCLMDCTTHALRDTTIELFTITRSICGEGTPPAGPSHMHACMQAEQNVSPWTHAGTRHENILSCLECISSQVKACMHAGVVPATCKGNAYVDFFPSPFRDP